MVSSATLAPAGAPFLKDRPDFGLAPLTVAWEITRACPLACVHCRAEAQLRRDARELSTDEGFALIDEAADMGVRVFVITGGDPLARADCYDLIARVRQRGMHPGFSPSVTGRLSAKALDRAVAAGAGTIHLSLDGSRAETHDGFRGVRGSYDRTLRAIEAVAAQPVRLQIGTTVSRRTVDELAEIVPLLAGRVSLWSLFFLVATGRAAASDVLSPQEYEEVLHWLATADLPFDARTIEAPAYRRVLRQLGRPVRPGVTDGNGFCFVSHTGEVAPSGFLPISVGSVREAPLRHWYREHPLFVALRDPDRLGGKCGRCEFRADCGGSRASAWAATGDPLAADPTCVHVPGLPAEASQP